MGFIHCRAKKHDSLSNKVVKGKKKGGSEVALKAGPTDFALDGDDYLELRAAEPTQKVLVIVEDEPGKAFPPVKLMRLDNGNWQVWVPGKGPWHIGDPTVNVTIGED